MDPIARFAEYAAAFEKSFESDDWSLIEPYFTDDAVYAIDAAEPYAGRHEGRDAVLAGLKGSVDALDRKFDSRELELLEGPELRDGNVWLSWRVTYRIADAPPLAMEGEETAHFDGDRIQLLQDVFPQASTDGVNAWLAEHGAKLPA